MATEQGLGEYSKLKVPIMDLLADDFDRVMPAA